LIQQLIVKNKSHRIVEKALFKKASDPVALQFILRRYKIRESSDISKRFGSGHNATGMPFPEGGAK